MKSYSKPMDFLGKARKDKKLSARILAAVERGGNVTAGEVLEIAKEFGYSFTKKEFQKAVQLDIARRFAAGEIELANIAGKRRAFESPESSCAKGCLSYTVSWHPPEFKQVEPAINPIRKVPD